MRQEETERVPVRAAAEAVVELLRGADGERRRLFVVERAQAEVVGHSLLELHVARDDVDDVDANEEVLLEGFGDQGKTRAGLIFPRNAPRRRPFFSRRLASPLRVPRLCAWRPLP